MTFIIKEDGSLLKEVFGFCVYTAQVWAGTIQSTGTVEIPKGGICLTEGIIGYFTVYLYLYTQHRVPTLCIATDCEDVRMISGHCYQGVF